MVKKWIPKIYFICFFVYSIAGKACDCPPLPKLSKEYCNQQHLIFKGVVKSIGNCNQINHVLFRVQELYKGSLPEETKVYFDCSGDCKMNFYPGETWIIYANFIQLNKPKLSVCSRSRKLVDNEIKVATNFISNDFNFNEEREWLMQNFGLHLLKKNEENTKINTHRNQLPEREMSLLLIIVSLSGFVVLLFVVKKFLK